MTAAEVKAYADWIEAKFWGCRPQDQRVGEPDDDNPNREADHEHSPEMPNIALKNPVPT